MNLELLNPFGRQVPDRIDSTLSLAPALHYFSDAPPLLVGSTKKKETLAMDDEDTKQEKTVTTTTVTDRKAKQRASAAVARQAKSRRSSKKSLSSSSGSSIPATLDDWLLSQEDQEYRAAYHIMFNRRGSFIACGYGSGTLAVYSFNMRSLEALYSSKCHSPLSALPHHMIDNNNDDQDDDEPAAAGVTSVSWSRQSRTLLSASVGETRVKLWDNEHSFGRHQAWIALVRQKQLQQQQPQQQQAQDAEAEQGEKDNTDEPVESAADASTTIQSKTAEGDETAMSMTQSVFATDNNNARYTLARDKRHIQLQKLSLGSELPESVLQQSSESNQQNDGERSWQRHPCVSFDFYLPVGGPVQICPRCPTGGLAVLCDGSLVLFWLPKSAFVSAVSPQSSMRNEGDDAQDAVLQENEQDITSGGGIPPTAIVIPLWKEESSGSITCASFDHHGDRVYAATKNGMLLGFDIASIWKTLLRREATTTPNANDNAMDVDSGPMSLPVTLPTVACHFKISLGGVVAWHLLVSRNGKYLVVNSADGALRLFSTADLWEQPVALDRKPTWMFQDLVSKVKFVCCDLSGMDGEFLVGGANGDDNKYELYIWNTTTGALMDKLTGSPVQLYSVAWHPTRAFLAVATSDGLIDMWGPKMDWTAFAPDFQALPANVEYVEEEDEFDVDAEGRFVSEGDDKNGTVDNETIVVDVLSIEKVPVFASDSEGEEEVFNFETTMCRSAAIRSTLALPSGLED